MSHEAEKICSETVRRVTDLLAALGYDQGMIAKALFVEAVARGRVTGGDDEWIMRLTATTAMMARDSSRGIA